MLGANKQRYKINDARYKKIVENHGGDVAGGGEEMKGGKEGLVARRCSGSGVLAFRFYNVTVFFSFVFCWEGIPFPTSCIFYFFFPS